MPLDLDADDTIRYLGTRETYLGQRADYQPASHYGKAYRGYGYQVKITASSI